MEGYVYIARIIDHGGKFVNGYHKIGLSKQYKVRETQLNSTHLPFDVLMVRVFETEDMNQLEGLLHVCFEDYRVVKEYDYRKNITTEWFDVSDIEVFNYRIDKFVDLMGIDEVDMNQGIDNDDTLTDVEKEQVKKSVDLGRSNVRRDLNKKYWTQFLEKYNKIDSLYDKISPSNDAWIGKRITGIGGFGCVVSKSYTKVELYIDMYEDKVRNKMIFDKLYEQKENIEREIGQELNWLKLENRRSSRIELKTVGNIYDETVWDEMNDFMLENMPKFSNVMTKYCDNLDI